MSAALMTLTGVSRSFGGLKAVQDVSLAVPQGSLTALIDQLEEMGLVKRCNDPMDRRKSLISLTPAGRCEMNKIMDNYIQNLSLFFQDVDPGELKQFTESLRFAVEFMKKLQVG